MEMVRDKLMQMFKKGISLIECVTEVKTSDGFIMRVFAMGFTCRSWKQINKNAKAGAQKKKEIRARMVKVIQEKCSGKRLQELVAMLKSDNNRLDKELGDELKKIRPMANVCVRKIKTVRRPRLDLKELRAL